MKRIVVTTLLSIILLVIGWAVFSHSPAGKKFLALNISTKKEIPDLSAAFKHKLNLKASVAKSFVMKKDYNQQFCFLVDMSIPSGQNRFFVYNLVADSIINSGLVTHGNCNQDWLEGRKYDNDVGSGCTSLGKYKIGNSYMGKFGLAYKLYGLDKTNSNAFSRFIVLHAHDCVPDTETENEICQSLGCPTVSPAYLKKLERLINSSGKPVLLWLYN